MKAKANLRDAVRTGILNEDDMDYFPMRKEYRLEDATRDDKEDKYFGR